MEGHRLSFISKESSYNSNAIPRNSKLALDMLRVSEPDQKLDGSGVWVRLREKKGESEETAPQKPLMSTLDS